MAWLTQLGWLQPGQTHPARPQPATSPPLQPAEEAEEQLQRHHHRRAPWPRCAERRVKGEASKTAEWQARARDILTWRRRVEQQPDCRGGGMADAMGRLKLGAEWVLVVTREGVHGLAMHEEQEELSTLDNLIDTPKITSAP